MLLQASLPATVTAKLVSPGGKTLRTWQLQAKAGATRFKLAFPRSAARPGRYPIRWTATAAGSKPLVKTTYVRVVGAAKKRHTASFVPAATRPRAPPVRPGFA